MHSYSSGCGRGRRGMERFHGVDKRKEIMYACQLDGVSLLNKISTIISMTLHTSLPLAIKALKSSDACSVPREWSPSVSVSSFSKKTPSLWDRLNLCSVLSRTILHLMSSVIPSRQIGRFWRPRRGGDLGRDIGVGPGTSALRGSWSSCSRITPVRLRSH